ncbi:aa3-type cytochrome c oxidase subunit IV [uncultured Sphingomonas sp.]|nr:aa3-type cytochrome c oxidase subunit IV [uncultured Sphingomonas sp.]
MADKSGMKAHVATYAGVMNLLKWGSVGAIVIVALVIWLIHR